MTYSAIILLLFYSITILQNKQLKFINLLGKNNSNIKTKQSGYNRSSFSVDNENNTIL